MQPLRTSNGGGNMKIKLWFRSLIYIILLLIVVFVGRHYFAIINKMAQTFQTNPYNVNFVSFIFFSCIGVILGLENFIIEVKKNGVWSLNTPKLILVGLPSLYFSFSYLIYFSGIEFIQNVIAYPISILLNGGTTFIYAFQLIFGFSIITSFYKANNNT